MRDDLSEQLASKERLLAQIGPVRVEQVCYMGSDVWWPARNRLMGPRRDHRMMQVAAVFMAVMTALIFHVGLDQGTLTTPTIGILGNLCLGLTILQIVSERRDARRVAATPVPPTCCP